MCLTKLAIKSPITSTLNMIFNTGAEKTQHEDDQNLLHKNGGVIALKHNTVKNFNGNVFAISYYDVFSVVHVIFVSVNKWKLNNTGNDKSNDEPKTVGVEVEHS